MRPEGERRSRVGIYLVQKATTIVFVEDSSEAPRLFLKWLHVLDLDHKHISRLCGLDLEGASQVVNSCQVDVLHVVRAIVVANLTPCPVHAFNLNNLPILYFARERDWKESMTIKWCQEERACHQDAIYSVVQCQKYFMIQLLRSCIREE